MPVKFSYVLQDEQGRWIDPSYGSEKFTKEPLGTATLNPALNHRRILYEKGWRKIKIVEVKTIYEFETEVIEDDPIVEQRLSTICQILGKDKSIWNNYRDFYKQLDTVFTTPHGKTMRYMILLKSKTKLSAKYIHDLLNCEILGDNFYMINTKDDLAAFKLAIDVPIKAIIDFENVSPEDVNNMIDK